MNFKAILSLFFHEVSGDSKLFFKKISNQDLSSILKSHILEEYGFLGYFHFLEIIRERKGILSLFYKIYLGILFHF